MFKRLSFLAAAVTLSTLMGACSTVGTTLTSASNELNSSYNKLMDNTLGKVGMSSGSIARNGSGPVYTPISGGDHLKGLFDNEDHFKASYGQTAWPRVALTYLKYGDNLACWTVKATIWSSPIKSHNETFKICSDAPIIISNMTGDQGEIQTIPLIAKLNKSIAMGVPNTGDRHTNGPTPPRHPFLVEVGSHEPMGPNKLKLRLDQVNVRIAFTAGYVQESQGSIASTMEEFRDYRMWISSFDPSGRVTD